MTEEPSVRNWESDFKRAENEVKKKVILIQRCSEAQGYLWTVSFYTATGIFMQQLILFERAFHL